MSSVANDHHGDGVVNCFSGLSIWSSPSAASRTRPENLSTQEADALTAKELNELSTQERLRVEEQLHGVHEVDEIEDDLDLVQKRLSQLEDEIKRIRYKQAYERAHFLSSSYVDDRDFRLMFLRCDDFHPRKAAERMVRFFELKLELFGVDKLVRRIEADDLSEEDRDSITRGMVSILPHRDRAGRRVLCYHGTWGSPSQVRSYTWPELWAVHHIFID